MGVAVGGVWGVISPCMVLQIFHFTFELRELTGVFELEMRLIVAAIYTNFITSIVDDSGIEQVDGYVARPTSNMLMLKFEHV